MASGCLPRANSRGVGMDGCLPDTRSSLRALHTRPGPPGLESLGMCVRPFVFVFVIAMAFNGWPSLLAEGARLPTGARLEPASAAWPVGNFPLAAVTSPDGAR